MKKYYLLITLASAVANIKAQTPVRHCECENNKGSYDDIINRRVPPNDVIPLMGMITDDGIKPQNEGAHPLKFISKGNDIGVLHGFSFRYAEETL